MFNRRQFMRAGAGGGLLAGLPGLMPGLMPAWARPSSQGNTGLVSLAGTRFDLTVGDFPVTIDGRAARAIGVNGSLPAPLLRFREGETVTINVANTLKEDTSIHWHGLLVPFEMDGVPGVTYPGIKPGETFTYRFAPPQNGTYWYHSHSGLQEQIGHFGPIVIDPKHADPVAYDREYVLMLSDWSFEDPHRIFAKLKKMSDAYNYQQRTVGDFLSDAARRGVSDALAERAMWGSMRMSPRDIADVTGATYRYLINGFTTGMNWNGTFVPGERVRLRIINASAMTLFNVRMPGLPMTIVQADGLNVAPLETDEFQIGVAETYDVVIQPEAARPYAFVAESIDRSGQAVATFGPEPGMRAEIPALRPTPTLSMKDMGMDHGAMDHGAMDHGGADQPQADHAGMDHSAMTHGDMTHGGEAPAMTTTKADLRKGPGVANIAAAPMSRLDEPGIGLEDVGHRVMRYSQLRSLEPIPDKRPPERDIEIHLTSNMERYMWSFDGVKFSEIKAPIVFHEGERLRVTLVNDTMMPHPIHLHGMFFELNNGGGDHRPRKHTVIVKPAEKLSFDVSANAVGDWAFHCHLLYHMHAGMMQVVSVLPRPDHGEHGAHEGMDHSKMDHDSMDHGAHSAPDASATGGSNP
ncbi:MAG: copper resistance system multicopper oxidase [Hyphomonadaceae bacterium]